MPRFSTTSCMCTNVPPDSPTVHCYTCRECECQLHLLVNPVLKVIVTTQCADNAHSATPLV